MNIISFHLIIVINFVILFLIIISINIVTIFFIIYLMIYLFIRETAPMLTLDIEGKTVLVVVH